MFKKFSSRLRVLPNEVHFALLNQMSTLAEWKNYSEAYPHLATDNYFWKKLMVKFPTLNLFECQNINWVDAVNYILDNGGNVYELDHESLLFFTIISQKKFDMARLFLNKGFDVNRKIYNETALIHCVYKNNEESVKFLLENGADVNVKVYTYLFSALAAFCYRYYFHYNDNMLQLLTDHGADYNLKNNNRDVALHYLIRRLKEPIFLTQPVDIYLVKKIFTQFVQKTDMTVVNSCNKTLLHELCTGSDSSMYWSYDEEKYWNGNDDDEDDEDDEDEDVWPVEILDLVKFIITLFLNAGVPINAQDGEGYTAVDYTINYNLDSTLCEFLRENGGLSRTEID